MFSLVFPLSESYVFRALRLAIGRVLSHILNLIIGEDIASLVSRDQFACCHRLNLRIRKLLQTVKQSLDVVPYPVRQDS